MVEEWARLCFSEQSNAVIAASPIPSESDML